MFFIISLFVHIAVCPFVTYLIRLTSKITEKDLKHIGSQKTLSSGLGFVENFIPLENIRGRLSKKNHIASSFTLIGE